MNIGKVNGDRLNTYHHLKTLLGGNNMRRILGVMAIISIILTVMCGCGITYDNDTPNINISTNRTEIEIVNYEDNGYAV